MRPTKTGYKKSNVRRFLRDGHDNKRAVKRSDAFDGQLYKLPADFNHQPHQLPMRHREAVHHELRRVGVHIVTCLRQRQNSPYSGLSANVQPRTLSGGEGEQPREVARAEVRVFGRGFNCVSRSIAQPRAPLKPPLRFQFMLPTLQARAHRDAGVGLV